jgi:hypothetical protein
VIRLLISLSVVLTACLVACTSPQSGPPARPEASLVGKWEALDVRAHDPVQFEFFADGTVMKNEKLSSGKWRQESTGSFKFIDSGRVKLELQPSWFYGASIYELVWQGQDHVGLRAADETIQLSRVKP